jgi:hypothetical protein
MFLIPVNQVSKTLTKTLNDISHMYKYRGQFSGQQQCLSGRYENAPVKETGGRAAIIGVYILATR